MRRIIGWVLKQRLAVIVAVVLATVAFAWSIPRIKFGTSVYDLVIDELPENDRYQAFINDFGADEIIRIVVRGGDVLSPERFEAIQTLSEQAEQIPGVRQVISLPMIKKTVDLSGEKSIPEFAEIIAPVALFNKNLISQDRQSTIITLLLENNAPRESIIQAAERLIAEAPKTLALYQIGMPLVSKALADYTAADFRRLPPITLLIITALLFILFHARVCLLLPVMTVIIAQIWTFGLMAWMQIPLSMLTMILPVFLIAVGTAYCLHLCAEYEACAQTAVSQKEAVFHTFCNLTFPTVLAVTTTFIGIGSLSISRIVAIREFSLFACFGMFSLLVLLLTFFPAVLSFFPLRKSREVKASVMDRWFTAFLQKIVILNSCYRKQCLAALGGFLVFLLIGILQVRVETNPVEYFKKDTMISRHFHDIYQDLSGSFPVHVVMDGNSGYAFEDLARTRTVAEVQKFLETLPGVDKTISFVDYVKLVNYIMNRYDPKYYALPEESFELRMIINNFKIILGQDILGRFMNADFSRTNIMMLTHISSSRDFLEARQKILSHVKSQFDDAIAWHVTGFGMVMSASSFHLTKGQVKSLSLALLLIFGVMALLFLSTKVGLIAVLPNLFPIAANFGLMGWFGINLSVVTSLVASIAIGLAVDDTIHYLFRYNNEFKKDLDKDRAMTAAILSVGKPIFFTTLTISCGFVILIFSHFKPTSLFGVMMVITMFSALVGDLILLPSLMLQVELVTAWDLLKLMPTIGGIPPGVAHELRQPLNAIKIGSEYLKMMELKGQPVSKEQLSRVIGEISMQVNRASTIIDRLMAFGQQPEPSTGPVDINQAIGNILHLVENEIKLDNIALQTDFQNSLPPIRANAQRMGQVFFNVLTNAREAVMEKQAQDPDSSRSISMRTFLKEGRVVVEISDSGVGIAAHLVDRIFEPFFSTKGTGKGLGLAITRQIIKSYGGTVAVESNPETGTTVRMGFAADSPSG